MKINLKLNPIDGPLYVGFSGGADSTALLLLAHDLPQELKAVHFEHGIRAEESRLDALWCREFCQKRRIEFQEIVLNVPENLQPGENLEAAARRLRLQAWIRIAGNKKIRVLLGHHAGDRTENLLIRLARGSNVSGLCSMKRQWNYENITFERPLLDFSRQDIEKFLRQAGVNEWRTDHTNSSDSYQRNFIRNKLLPQWCKNFPPAEKGLLQAMEVLEQDADFIEKTADTLAKANLTNESVPISFWRQAHPALLPRLLRHWFKNLGHGDYLPDHFIIERIITQVNRASTETRILHLNDNFELCFDRDEVWLRPRSRPEFTTIHWNWRNEPHQAGFTANLFPPEKAPDHGVRFDAAIMPDKLEITVPHPGDAMIPFGQNKNKKITRLAIDAKLNAREKSSLKVLKLPTGEIIWIPGLRRSNFAPVTTETTQILVINYTT